MAETRIIPLPIGVRSSVLPPPTQAAAPRLPTPNVQVTHEQGLDILVKRSTLLRNGALATACALAVAGSVVHLIYIQNDQTPKIILIGLVSSALLACTAKATRSSIAQFYNRV